MINFNKNSFHITHKLLCLVLIKLQVRRISVETNDYFFKIIVYSRGNSGSDIFIFLTVTSTFLTFIINKYENVNSEMWIIQTKTV